MVSAVHREEEVRIDFILVQNDRKIPHASGEIVVRGAAVQSGCGHLQNDAKVFPGIPVIQ
jgi:hypothetical protein